MSPSPARVELKLLRKQRNSLYSQVFHTRNLVDNTFDPYILGMYRDKLDIAYDLFDEIQHSMEKLDLFTDYRKDREQFEQKYYETIDLIEQRMLEAVNVENIPVPAETSNETLTADEADNDVDIVIEPFNGDPVDWIKYHDTFKSLVHDDDNISPVKKFFLLKNSLIGEAATIATLHEASEQNYLKMWDLLKERYHKPRNIINGQLKCLFELPSIDHNTSVNLRLLVEQVQAHVDALRKLEQPVEHWDAFLIYIVVNKLDENTREAWERTLGDADVPEYKQLIAFINARANVDGEETNKLDEACALPEEASTSTDDIVTNDNSCVVCKQSHPLHTCPKFKNLSEEERLNIVEREKLCTNCLNRSHTQKPCKRGRCRKCNKRHNTLLHISSKKLLSARKKQKSTSTMYDIIVLVSTAYIKIMDKSKQEHLCRAVISSEAQSNFITESLVDRLQLDKHKINLTFTTLGTNFHTKYNVITIIKSLDNKYQRHITFVVVPNLPGPIPPREFDRSNIIIPTDVKLADPNFHKPGPIDLVLGIGVYMETLGEKRLSANNGAIGLHKTSFGWTVGGTAKVPAQDESILINTFSFTIRYVNNDDQ